MRRWTRNRATPRAPQTLDPDLEALDETSTPPERLPAQPSTSDGAPPDLEAPEQLVNDRRTAFVPQGAFKVPAIAVRQAFEGIREVGRNALANLCSERKWVWVFLAWYAHGTALKG
jgi:hypothetical protein